MKAVTIGRIAVLMVLFTIGLASLFAEPDENAENWGLVLVASKVIAVATLYATVKLHNRWKHTDEWLKAYYERCDEAMETPNTMHYDEDDD